MEKNTKTVFSQEPTRLKMRLSGLCESKIRTACSVFPDREWSGAAFYRYVDNKGDSNMEDTEIEVVDFCLQDIGNATYTEYNLDGDTAAYYAEHIDTLAGTKVCLLHSHNRMAAYFSGTDVATLKEQAEQCNNVLSIVVNNAGNYVAKFTEKRHIINSESITINAHEDTLWKYMGEKPCTAKDNYTTHENHHEEYDRILCWDCDIERPIDAPIDEDFKKECTDKEEIFNHKKADAREEGLTSSHWERLLNDKEAYANPNSSVTTMLASIHNLSFIETSYYHFKLFSRLNDNLSDDFICYFIGAWFEYYSPSMEQLSQVIDKFEFETRECDYPEKRDLIIELLTYEYERLIENGNKH